MFLNQFSCSGVYRVEQAKKSKKTNFTFFVGFLLIIAGLIIWLYSIVELGKIDFGLSQNLAMEEVWRLEGALLWWESFYSTAIIPATTALVISGIGLVSFGVIKTKKPRLKISDYIKIEIIEADEEPQTLPNNDQNIT